MTARLARRYGAEPAPATCVPSPVRPLRELALDNASEGCVRETYGAVVALWQSRAAADPAVRATMMPIAADESSHAALSWRLDDWLRTQLPRAQHTHLDEAMHDAMQALHRGALADDTSPVTTIAGLPSGDDAERLLDATAAGLGLS